jgi:Tol biopolymer transport system component
MAAHFVNVKTGKLRTLKQPDPALEAFCGGAWTADGRRLACDTYGRHDPSRNGIYTIPVAGGGLNKITSNPGGSDQAGDFSPDGKRLVFVRSKNEKPVGIFVINVDGSGQRSLAPQDMILDESGFSGSWSPSGNNILFVAHHGVGGPKRIWIVNADGGAPQELPITSCLFGCYSPNWSPDGTKIIFARHNGAKESLYVVDPDGTGLAPVSDSEGDSPDWGTP